MRKFLIGLLLISFYSSAQIADNFTDGNFSANPAWSGDNSEFIVNASSQLQVNNTVAGSSYLSTAISATSLNNMEWRFYLKQNFSSSSSNNGRVYLASDQANLESSLNGYYLQFGETGTLDAIELFKQTGTTSVSVARGTDGKIANSFTLGIKVTRDGLGNWNIYADVTGGTTYILEATGTDNTYTTTNFFGITTVYTLSNSTKFYYDDFYNGPLVVDNTAPIIISSVVISANQLDVLFDENVDLITAQVLANYSANNGAGNPSTVTRDASNFNLVHLTFAIAFVNGLTTTLTVTGVQDLSGNTITSATSNFIYNAPITAAYKDVIITEIMADPAPQVGLPTVEFVEIYNKSSNTLNLNGWVLTDNSSTATLGNYNLAPNQYLIICNNVDTALFTSFGSRLGVSSFPSLNNSVDGIYFKTSTSVLIDSVNYSDAWYKDVVKKDGGWTLELINPNAPVNCPVPTNWIASNNTLGGTPGTQNSVYTVQPDVSAPVVLNVSVADPSHISICFSEGIDAAMLSQLTNFSINNGIGAPTSLLPNSTLTCVDLTLGTNLTSGTTYTITFLSISDCSGNVLNLSTFNFTYYIPKPFDVVINEIMADPDPIISSLPNYEYVELYNKTNYPINLYNWQFLAGTTMKLLPNVTIPADSFIVLAAATAAPNYPPSYNVIGITSFPALTNSGQTLMLKTPQGTVVSVVTYSDDWYKDAIKKEGGWSLEQIDPINPCAGIFNWKASVSGDAGTPGRKNSVNASNPDNVSPQLLRIGVLAADTIQLFFNEPLDNATMLSTSIYSIDNGIGNPTQLKTIALDFKSVVLTLSNPIVIGTIYTLTVNNSITDCVGNPVSIENTAKFALPEQALPNDIVINEILADPNEGGVDFVELYNRSNKVIDLKTISLAQYDTLNNIPINLKSITTENFLLFPNDYIVLSGNGEVVKNQYNITTIKNFVDLPSMISMSISAGTVCILNTTSIVDLLKYDVNMHFALLNSTKGITLERIDFDRSTQDRTNWHSAAATVGYGTPGYKNSQYNDVGVTDNAIEVVPEIFSPDEDGMNDVVNIHYKFDMPGFVANITIYDSKGRLTKLLVRNELLATAGTFSWDGINESREKARIGIYIFYLEVFNLKGDVKKYKKTCVLGGKLQ